MIRVELAVACSGRRGIGSITALRVRWTLESPSDTADRADGVGEGLAAAVLALFPVQDSVFGE